MVQCPREGRPEASDNPSPQLLPSWAVEWCFPPTLQEQMDAHWLQETSWTCKGRSGTAFAVCISMGTGRFKAKPCVKERSKDPYSYTLGTPCPPSRGACRSHAASGGGVAPYRSRSIINENIFSLVNTNNMTPEKGGVTAFRKGLRCKGQGLEGPHCCHLKKELLCDGLLRVPQLRQAQVRKPFVGPLCCDKVPGQAG